MKRIKTTDITTGVAYPLTKDGIDFLQDSYKETIASLAKALIPSYAANTPYVLHGMVKSSLGGSNYSYSAGSVFYNGEIYDFDAIASISITTSDVCTITTTNDGTADPIEFTDGSTKNVHNIRKVTLANAASVTNGATQFNYSSCVFVGALSKVNDSIGSITTVGGTATGAGVYSYKLSRERDYIEVLYQLSLTTTSAGVTRFEFNLPLSKTNNSSITAFIPSLVEDSVLGGGFKAAFIEIGSSSGVVKCYPSIGNATFSDASTIRINGTISIAI